MKYAPVTSLNVLLTQDNGTIPVGKLALNNRQIWFQYDAAFLGREIELSPYKLPLRPDVVTCEDRVFDGLFGLFNDSLPDGWGRLLLDRHMRSLGIAPESLTPLDRLAYVGQRGMGALVYQPEYVDQKPSSDPLDLDRLAQESRDVLDGAPKQVLEKLLSLGGSPQGARPKVTVGVSHDKKRIIHGIENIPEDYDHWIVKFTTSTDPDDNGTIEYAYSLMAKAAGINMPETYLFPAEKGAGYFGVKRFDRDGNRRRHIHTVGGLLHADHRLPALDYESILKATLALTKSMTEVEAVFRMAAFNVFSHNRDDHSKNFSFLMDDDGTWHTAPAYDLVFSSGPGGEHSTTVMGEGKNPTRHHLQQLGKKLDIKKADEIIDHVADAVADWKKFAAAAGVSMKSIKLIENNIGKKA